jgi:hypothetical protein
MDKITAYYTLCAIGLNTHIINNIPDSSNLFTKKEIDLYFRKKDGLYVLKESVVGASEQNASGTVDNKWYNHNKTTYKCIVY